MGKHENQNEKQVQDNGRQPGRPIPPKDPPDGKHSGGGGKQGGK